MGEDGARTYLNSILEKVDKGTWRPDAKMTVEELLADWLAAKRSAGLRENTTAMYEKVIEGWLVPHVGGLRVGQLSPTRVQQMVEKLRTDGSRLRGALSQRSVQVGPSACSSRRPCGRLRPG